MKQIKWFFRMVVGAVTVFYLAGLLSENVQRKVPSAGKLLLE